MSALYIIGLAATGLIMGMNVLDEVRARRGHKKRNHHKTSEL
ncbi:MAG: hypothetical protein ACR650_08335 [Methylocystis sp.]